jgi:DNA-binding CsgD family transcriptional regulator
LVAALNNLIVRLRYWFASHLPDYLKPSWFYEDWDGVDRRVNLEPQEFLASQEHLDLEATVRDIAIQQGRSETIVYQEILQAGMRQIVSKKFLEFQKRWDSLSTREKEVAALTMFGLKSHDIADLLSLSYDTVRSHSKSIYKKFGLSNKETRQARNDLRYILNEFDKDFSLREWWHSHHQ